MIKKNVGIDGIMIKKNVGILFLPNSMQSYQSLLDVLFSCFLAIHCVMVCSIAF